LSRSGFIRDISACFVHQNQIFSDATAAGAVGFKRRRFLPLTLRNELAVLKAESGFAFRFTD
jgi:hypothetical protein